MRTSLFLLAIALTFLLSPISLAHETDLEVNVDDTTQFQKQVGRQVTVNGWIARGKPGLMIWLEDRRTGIVIASQKGRTWRSLPPEDSQKLATQVRALEAKYDHCFVTATGTLCRKAPSHTTRDISFFYFPVDGIKISTIKTAVYVIKRIPKGQIITKDSIEERNFEPRNFGFAFLTQKNAVGSKAKYDLEAGQILIESDIQQNK